MPSIRLERKNVLGDRYVEFYQDLSDYLLEFDLDKDRKELYFELQSVLYSNDWRKIKKALKDFNIAAKAFTESTEERVLS